MLFKYKTIQKKTGAILLLPVALLLTQCAKDFDAPTKTGAPKVAKEVVSGLAGPSDVVIVPDSAAAAPGKSLAHEDLLVANAENNTIVQIDKSVEPHTIVAFADQTDTPELNQPTGIAFDPNRVNGDIYVSNLLDETGTTVSAGAITVFNKDGAFNRVINNALFGRASGIVYDFENSTPTSAVFFVSNRANNTIVKLVSTAGGDVVSLYADLNFLHLGGANPTQLAISPIHPHNLYVANTGIRPNLPDGDAQAPVGSTLSIIPTTSADIGEPTVADVPQNDIRLILAGEVIGPLSLDFDSTGNLFVGAHKKGTLAMIDPEIGFAIKSVETGESDIQGMTAGSGGIYITTEAGKIIEVNQSLLKSESGGESGGHHG